MLPNEIAATTPPSADDCGHTTTLDPADWQALRRQGHQMLDDMIDHLQSLRDQPVWRAAPADVRAAFRAQLPLAPSDLATVHDDFRRLVLPFHGGNLHPGFMGWVQGGGTPVGMLAEMLAGGLNANLGGRDHMPIAVERQIVDWVRDIFGFPTTAGGLFLTGTSQANFVAVLAARTRALSPEVRRTGLKASPQLVAYTSTEAHGCIPRAIDMAGIGSDNLRSVATAPDGRMDLAALEAAIEQDMAAGHIPFLIVAAAGTVNTGAIDDLAGIADIAERHGLWFHVDGALGALGVLADDLAPLFAGIERADSIAFDFHKWGQVPYDAGFILARRQSDLRTAFGASAAYLARARTGLAGGDWWPSDDGPDLSRGFRALKTWFTIRTYGLKALGASISANCGLARLLGERVAAEPELHLLAPVALNVVCFGYEPADTDRTVNARIVEALHQDGVVAPSLTRIDGGFAIRAAIVNHRTTAEDIEHLVAGVLRFGRLLSQ
jgi:glutamate/tyrosine decarboxylase-like PLP-dependent enzyme